MIALSAPSDRQKILPPLLIAAFQWGARSTSNRKVKASELPHPWIRIRPHHELQVRLQSEPR